MGLGEACWCHQVRFKNAEQCPPPYKGSASKSDATRPSRNPCYEAPSATAKWQHEAKGRNPDRKIRRPSRLLGE